MKHILGQSPKEIFLFLLMGTTLFSALPTQCMRRRHKSERRGDDLATGKAHRLKDDLEGQSSVVEEREIGRWHAQILRQ